MVCQRSGRTVTMKDIFYLFGEAFKKAAKVETAVNAFRSTGIYPLNEKIFDKYFVDQDSSVHRSLEQNPEFIRCRAMIQNINNRAVCIKNTSAE